jgi:hypothetical protein
LGIFSFSVAEINGSEVKFILRVIVVSVCDVEKCGVENADGELLWASINGDPD